MVFCALHLDPEDLPPGQEEVYLVMPGGAKTALAVPLDGVPEFLPLLERAIGSASLPRCPACGAEIPRLAYDDHDPGRADPG